MKLDRKFQLQVLEKLRSDYPELVDTTSFPGYGCETIRANLFYLEEHELLTAGAARRDLLGALPDIFEAKITAKGLDFLEADGGLDAILRTVTVKFDPDQLREILAAKLGQLDIPPEKKGPLQEKFRTMPADVLQAMVIKLAEKGLEHAPDALSLIQKMVL